MHTLVYVLAVFLGSLIAVQIPYQIEGPPPNAPFYDTILDVTGSLSLSLFSALFECIEYLINTGFFMVTWAVLVSVFKVTMLPLSVALSIFDSFNQNLVAFYIKMAYDVPPTNKWHETNFLCLFWGSSLAIIMTWVMVYSLYMLEKIEKGKRKTTKRHSNT